MRVYENGIYRDVTAEEAAAFEAAQEDIPAPEVTTEEILQIIMGVIE